MLLCLTVTSFSLFLFASLYSYQYTNAQFPPEFPQGVWDITVSMYPEVPAQGGALVISHTQIVSTNADTGDNNIKITGTLDGKPIIGNYYEESGKITFKQANAINPPIYTGYLIVLNKIWDYNDWGIIYIDPTDPSCYDYQLVGSVQPQIRGAFLFGWFATLETSQ
jgi:hypothetical protein